MRLRIRHETKYTYNRPVFLEPHVLRLRPRSDGSQKLLRFAATTEPAAAGQTEFTDMEGNAATQMWFNDKTQALSITCESDVQTLRSNPFDFLITDPGVFQVPARYDAQTETYLTPYCLPERANGPVSEYAARVLGSTGPSSLDFLRGLCLAMQSEFVLTVRDHGYPRPPQETLQLRNGACRDLVVLFMEICRQHGLAARFVSGYHFDDGRLDSHHLHAWAEVYLPGGGWRGFDPSSGLVVADAHVPLAASHHPSGAAPVTGTFRGNDVSVTLKTHVDVERIA